MVPLNKIVLCNHINIDFCSHIFLSYRIRRGTAETLLDDKSFVDTYKDVIIEAAYNDYEDEYDVHLRY